MENKYRTQDIYIAAYLYTDGATFSHIERAPGSRSVWFMFNDKEGCNAKINEYMQRKGLVIPLDYKNAMDYLKEQIDVLKFQR